MSSCPFLRLNNVATRDVHVDCLYRKKGSQNLIEKIPCSETVCMGSTMYMRMKKPTDLRSREDILVHAKDFLEQYYISIRRQNSPAHDARWKQVMESIEKTGSYDLTETELVFGAKLAWRNAARCIGRIQWSKLQVFDCRGVTTSTGMFEAICEHMKYSTNKGNIRSAITIFPQKTDSKHDYRIWNSQLISYAGYKNPDGTITGDPFHVEFTELCMKLGWRSKRTMFDVLPLVLSANGDDPDYFEIPPDLVLQIPLVHPKYDWFKDLGLKWYSLPAVANMMLDCGGLQFTATPFNGWYMSTEIGCRNLCDTNRYNLTETIAKKMGLDTRTPVTLWKDKAMVEANIAVLHSFQILNVTIVDHHTASESFMKHQENEQRLRNGCPADWVWVVPPMSSSLTPVFHQEMANYFLFPGFEYQEPAWKTHEWKCDQETFGDPKDKKKFHFKQVARAVKFTSKLFGSALSKRIKATILYASETGKSEMFAKNLGELFSHDFNATVMNMADYDIINIEHEALLIVVVSTFGNGDPPENGLNFAHNLYSMKMLQDNAGTGTSNSKLSTNCSASFIKANSQTGNKAVVERSDSVRGSINDDVVGPLSNVRFAVFALGSSAYPNFCAFGAYVDNLLGELGGERLLKLTKGDEMCGQDLVFQKWAPEVYSNSCETFCLDYNESLHLSLRAQQITASTVKFVESTAEDLRQTYKTILNRDVWECSLLGKRNLHGKGATERATLLCEISRSEDMNYEPGDHVGILPANRKDIVEGVIARLNTTFDPDKPVQLQILKETDTQNGVISEWVGHERLRPNSLRVLLTRFLDLTIPPSPDLLEFFASSATDPEERKKLTHLATDSGAYEEWRYWKFPNLLETLEEFPSVRPNAALLCAKLTPLQPRFYSISSAPSLYSHQIHLTVAVVQYRTEGGKGPIHYGVASNYLYELNIEDHVYLFLRSAPNFHLPKDVTKPIIMIGPGTGIAPFRGFWLDRMVKRSLNGSGTFGKMTLFFGCRTQDLDLYREEKESMLREGVLNQVHLALSRKPGLPKTYVQDLLKKEGATVLKQIFVDQGHFYVCGDCTMAEHVFKTLKEILIENGSMSEQQAENYMLSLRDENRYHEDIFGITLRTAESRETARNRLASQSNP